MCPRPSHQVLPRVDESKQYEGLPIPEGACQLPVSPTEGWGAEGYQPRSREQLRKRMWIPGDKPEG